MVDSLASDVQSTDRYLEKKIDVAETRYFIDLGLTISNLIGIGILYTMKFMENRVANQSDKQPKTWRNPTKIDAGERLSQEWVEMEGGKRMNRNSMTPSNYYNVPQNTMSLPR